MKEKHAGYGLLIAGLIVMCFATLQIVLVFTNAAQPLPLFNISQKPSTPTNTDINSLLSQLQAGGNPSGLSLPTPELIPAKTINEILNLTTYFFLMTFLAGFGYKLASLGIMLLRPIYVKVKTKDAEAVPSAPNETTIQPTTPASKTV